MTQQIEGTPPAALTAAQAAQFADQFREQPPQAQDRFVDTKQVDEYAADVIVEWLRINDLRELFPETLAVIVAGEAMVVTRFRWKAGPRDTLANVARRGGVEVTEQKRSRMSVPPDDRVIGAMHAAGVPFERLDDPEALDHFDDLGPVVDAIEGVRPSLRERQAGIVDGWLIPNGICEWVPEQAVFVVDRNARTITYDAFTFTDHPFTDATGRTGAGRGYGPNIVTRRDLDPSIRWEDDDVIVSHRSVPLLVDVTAEIRAMFAESELTLIER